jgi:hypothetical protein
MRVKTAAVDASGPAISSSGASTTFVRVIIDALPVFENLETLLKASSDEAEMVSNLATESARIKSFAAAPNRRSYPRTRVRAVRAKFYDRAESGGRIWTYCFRVDTNRCNANR